MSDERPDETLLIEARQLTLVSANASTGYPRESQLPFAYDDGTVYLLAQPEADWYRDVQKDQGVVVRIRHRGFRGRVNLPDSRRRARHAGRIATMFRQKYGAAAGQEADSRLLVAIGLQF